VQQTPWRAFHELVNYHHAMTRTTGHEVRARTLWVDCAKGISIILVVFHHSLFQDLDSPLYSATISSADALLAYFRMPLFFFVSGLFIHRSLSMQWGRFLRLKTGNLLYLYVLWSVVKWIFLAALPLLILGKSGEGGWLSVFTIFVEPPTTLWFIYALAVYVTIARLTSRVPGWSFVVSVGIYFVMAAVDFDAPFLMKLAKYLPMYLLGRLVWSKAMDFAERVRFYHMLFPIAYFPLVYWCITTVQITPVIFFLLNTLGVVAGIIIAANISRMAWSSALVYIGRNTLPIYVLHFLPVAAGKLLLPGIASAVPAALVVLALTVVSVAIPLCVKMVTDRFGIYWLFRAPFARSAT
jgi:uncharacterized membrane protein YcfT